MIPTPSDILAFDAADPLAAFRDRFHLPRDVIYLDGNSLGPLPIAAQERLSHVATREWGEGLIRSWNAAGWIKAPRRIGDKIAPLIGAAAGDVVAADSTSVNLYKLILAALGARPGRRTVLTETGNFPTDLYVAAGAAASVGARLRAVEPAALEAAIDQETAVVVLAHIHYKTAARRDMAALTAAAHAAGALVLWDLSHSAGAVRLDLNACGADLAVGCGYKFLNGGPGAPAFLFVAEGLQAALSNPVSGWMGHAAPFDFSDAYRPAAGVDRFLSGTPAILGMAALEAAVDLMNEADMAAIEAKSIRLWDLFAERMAARAGRFGFRLMTPGEPERRGSHIAYAHPHAYAIMHCLIERGVIGDFRAPDVLRFGLTPLYLNGSDVWRAVEILAEIMEREDWRAAPPRQPGAVT